MLVHNRWDRGGRSNVPFDQRICKYCKLNEIEDEFHFLCNCTKYVELRENYLPHLIQNPTKFNVINVMSSLDKCSLLALSKFIYCAMKVRDG